VQRLTLNRRPLFVRRGRLLLAACGISLTVFFCILSINPPSFLSQLDNRFFDGMIADESPPQWEMLPVVVSLDDESLARFGRWPWPRALVARLLASIAEMKPAAVGIDAVFAEPEESTLGHDTPASPVRLSAGDRALATALASGPNVLGFGFTFSPAGPAPAGNEPLHPLNIVSLMKEGADDPRGRLWHATGAIGSLPDFEHCVTASGFINSAVEQDGILRRMPLIIERDGRIYPSLALATVLRKEKGYEAVLASDWTGGSILKIGGMRIPLDERGCLRLRFRGWQSRIRPISAAELLQGKVAADALRGRVVFVGATAIGMSETVATPLRGTIAGVQVHGIAAENILNGDFARPASWLYRLLAVLVLGIFSTLVCMRLPLVSGTLVTGCAALAAWQGSVWLYRDDGLLLSPLLPLFALIVNFSLATIVRSLFMERSARRQTQDLAVTRDFIMTSLASLAEIRDTETGAHILRTQRYLLILCRELSRHPRFKPLLNEETIELIAKLAPLHDIGKVGLPDHLLRKTTGFTAEEYEEVKKHALYGRNAIARAESRAGTCNDEMLGYAKDIAYYHHERWDGTGYPEGLKGEQIPWSARLMALADAYDAMVSKRIYKEPIPHEAAVCIIIEGKGTMFDPDVVEAFLRVEDQWRRIAVELDDSAEIEVALD